MKKSFFILVNVLLFSLCVRAEGDTFGKSIQKTGMYNRVMIGVNIEESAWMADFNEFFPSIGVDALVPCGPKFSLGAFVSYTIFDIDGGLLASWRMDNNSCLIGGLGWSRTFYTSLIRIGFKTPGSFYFFGDFGPDFACNDCVIGLGLGCYIIGGKRR